jgi:hypothetical protein
MMTLSIHIFQQIHLHLRVIPIAGSNGTCKASGNDSNTITEKELVVLPVSELPGF